MSLISIRQLTAQIEGRAVLTEVDLVVKEGEIHAVMGPNGSGKTSLANVLMGNPRYGIEGGEMTFLGKNLLTMGVDERARAGLYVAWQNPLAIPGLNVFSLCKTAYEAGAKKIESVVSFKNRVEELLMRVGLTKEHLGRGVNEGFSGGERKRLELLQLLLLEPKLAILDELDSGLDEEGRAMVATVVNELKKKGTAFIVISHYQDLLKKIEVDRAWEMRSGKINAKKR